MRDVRQTKEWAEYMVRLGWRVEPVGRINVYIRPLGPLSVMKVQRVLLGQLDFDVIKRLAKKYRVMVNYIEIDEPRDKLEGWDKLTIAMQKEGYRPTMEAMLPTKSRWVDLHIDKEGLLAQMRPKHRYNIGLARRRGVQVKWYSGKDLSIKPELAQTFFEMFERNNKRIGVYGVPLKWFEAHMRAFGEKMWVAMAYRDNVLVAGAVFFKTDERLVYFYNGSTAQGRRDMAPTLIVWKAILLGNKAGLRWLDFEGVEDERKLNKRWRGFSRFKAGFGGNTVYYPPVFVKWLPGFF